MSVPDQHPLYRNPVLAADWPDPDAVRVGNEYYLVTSSFNRSPGLPVLHSRDLVNWDLLTHALPAVPPADAFTLPRHGGGVWAPAIRFHDGTFHITYPDPDRGVSVVSATDPAGPWSAPRNLLPGLGIIDPCPFWDEDGSAWLVHGWARSRSGVKNRLTLVPVDPGLTRATGPGTTVVDGEHVPGCHTLEGPKVHRRGGYYWIFAPAGGVATGWQSVFRARDVRGPYEHRIVMTRGGTTVNGPHQGAWIDTPHGTDWFLHFQDLGPVGRVVHLQPLRWAEDGWPVIGDAADAGTCGVPVARHPTPHGTTQGSRYPGGDDDFTTPGADASGRPGPQWRWQANPGRRWAQTGDGRLRLTALPNDTGNLRSLPQVLGQPLPGIDAVATTSLRLEGPDGARAGLTVLGRAYLWAGLARSGDRLVVVAAERSAGSFDETVREIAAVPAGTRLEVRLDVRAHAGSDEQDPVRVTVALRWQQDQRWVTVLDAVRPEAGHWIGAELALFAAAPLGGAPGTAEFGPFRLDTALLAEPEDRP
ncbi:glycoside hydrolase family 43 protein [Kineococcus sp. SYSU DK003]|uniref:glycoside hydrolase family 43 protein n=1 Tax=Kineococcus sp. SYSU DK003 TaxID=3383124 RepID=UPI003D7DE465